MLLGSLRARTKLRSAMVRLLDLCLDIGLTHSLQERPSTDTPHVDVNQPYVSGRVGYQGTALCCLFAILVIHNFTKLRSTGVNELPGRMVDGGEDQVGRDEHFVREPQLGLARARWERGRSRRRSSRRQWRWRL